jgi:hypothetical protein
MAHMPTWLCMAVDERLLQYWLGEQEARKRARSSLPARWRVDPRPEMEDVNETFVESMVAMNRVVRLVSDDR